MIRLLLLLFLLCTSCNKDPVVTRSASSLPEDPTDTAGINISVEVPDTTKVINKTY